MPILKKVDKDFFTYWTPEMAYVLGFFSADGSITHTRRDTHFISFTSMDKDLLIAIQRVMKSEHTVSRRNVRSGNVYRLQIGSKKMYADLASLGYSDTKTRRMTVPHMPKKFHRHFVRGYFDGDGNVWVGEVNKKRRVSTRVIHVAFTSCSTQFLLELQALLLEHGIGPGTLYEPKGKNFTRLQYSTKNALQLGKFMYNEQPKLFLKRKKLRFDLYTKLKI